jgi:hypothetical protein
MMQHEIDDNDVATRELMIIELQGSLFVSSPRAKSSRLILPDPKLIPKIGRKYQEKYSDNTCTYNEGLFAPH